jgi:hypothetical protein
LAIFLVFVPSLSWQINVLQKESQRNAPFLRAGADRYARYCASQLSNGAQLQCGNHTQGAAEMVEPLAAFLLKAL